MTEKFIATNAENRAYLIRLTKEFLNGGKDGIC